MSVGYRVVVEPLRVADRHVAASDRVQIALQLLPILGATTMAELLLAALKGAGFSPTKDGGVEKELRPGLVVVVDKDATTVTVTMEAERTVQGTGRSEAAAAQAADRAKAQAAASVQRDATTALATAEADVRAALDAVIQQVYVAALEEKAKSLGQVESMVKNEAPDGSLEVTIKIRT